MIFLITMMGVLVLGLSLVYMVVVIYNAAFDGIANARLQQISKWLVSFVVILSLMMIYNGLLQSKFSAEMNPNNTQTSITGPNTGIVIPTM